MKNVRYLFFFKFYLKIFFYQKSNEVCIKFFFFIVTEIKYQETKKETRITFNLFLFLQMRKDMSNKMNVLWFIFLA